MGFLDFLFRRKKAPPPPPLAASSPDRTMFGIPGQAAAPRSASDPSSSPDRTMFGIPGQAVAPASDPSASPDRTMFGIPGQAVVPSTEAAQPTSPPVASMTPTPTAAPPSAATTPSSDATRYVSPSAPAAEPVTAPTVMIKPPPRPRARISLKRGGAGGPWELVEREYTIGRSSSSDVVVADASVSGHHARLVPHGDGFAIRDLGSTNGTKVNGELVSGDRALREGDTITLGEAVLAYERA